MVSISATAVTAYDRTIAITLAAGLCAVAHSHVRACARANYRFGAGVIACVRAYARSPEQLCARACVRTAYATTVPAPNLWGVVVGKSCWGGGGDGVMLLL